MKHALLIALIALTACVRVPDFQGIDTSEANITYGQFDFSTLVESQVNLSFTDARGIPFSGIKVRLLNPVTETVLFKGLTDSNGLLKSQYHFPAYLEELIIEADYIGIPNRIMVPVSAYGVKLNYRGVCDPSEVIAYTFDPNSEAGNSSARMMSIPSLSYAASFSDQGVPANLLSERDYISSTLLSYINASLPEGQPVPTYHPTYLAEGKKTTLDIVKEADVWLTFVHEGAGWRNSIGYYVYPTDEPPTSVDQIDEITVLFPNLSMRGSGGGLVSGDKIKIGRFQPGVTIGIVLFANGWGGDEVDNSNYLVFADKKLNPEPDPALRQHNVLLWDEENELFLLGFEDVRRDNIPSKCDQDFNDAVLFVSSNPAKAISRENVSPVDKPGTADKDGDGINDTLDEYPDDPDKAYDSYYPSANTYGSFAFEDNWPEMGDYDFNDLVVDYQIKQVMNSKNKVTQIEPKFLFRAAGAGYRNGFGFQLDVSSSVVKSVSGSEFNPNFIRTNPNGTEANQSKAVIVVADNVHFLMNHTGFINTQSGSKVGDKELSLKIELASPQEISELGFAPYNPFLIVNQDRGREIHLPGYSPTDLAEDSWFGVSDDGTNPNIANSYYKSKTALPWVIHLPESFDYPMEKSDIRDTHLRFDTWAKSNGFSYLDWYRPQQGYRNSTKIYGQ